MTPAGSRPRIDRLRTYTGGALLRLLADEQRKALIEMREIASELATGCK